MEFICMCMSPAVDASVRLPKRPQDGEVLKDVEETENPGGKGLNVARWLALRGNKVSLGGLLGRDNAALFEKELAACGIEDSFLRVSGSTRRNEMIAYPGGMFKLNRAAFPFLSANDWSEEALLSKVSAEKHCACILSGSLPPAVPSSFYATFGRRVGVPVVLDASGESLVSGMECSPAIVKPNAEECAAVVGFVPHTEEEFRKTAELFLAKCKVVVISDGASGCWFAEKRDGLRIFHLPSPDSPVVDTTAAGDTLLAEFCHRFFLEGALTEEVARWSVAAGAAAVGMPGSVPPDPSRVLELFKGTEVAK